MGAQCLSVCGPCKEICKLCQQSYDRYVSEALKRQLESAVRLLRANGYRVNEPMPDANCITLPDGDCVGGLMAGKQRCMHD